jgi:hypothetical protein
MMFIAVLKKTASENALGGGLVQVTARQAVVATKGRDHARVIRGW